MLRRSTQTTKGSIHQRYTQFKRNPAATLATVSHAVFSSPTFAWCVTLDLDGERPLPDNAFDLLPGIDYRVPWPEGEELPGVMRVGNVMG